MSVILIAQQTSFVFLRWKSVIRPVTRGMPAGVLHPLRIWLHALGFHGISKTNTLIRSELHADGITKPIQDKKRSCYCVRARTADDRRNRFIRNDSNIFLVRILPYSGSVVTLVSVTVRSTTGNSDYPIHCGVGLASSATGWKAGVT